MKILKKRRLTKFNDASAFSSFFNPANTRSLTNVSLMLGQENIFFFSRLSMVIDTVKYHGVMFIIFEIVRYTCIGLI